MEFAASTLVSAIPLIVTLPVLLSIEINGPAVIDVTIPASSVPRP